MLRTMTRRLGPSTLAALAATCAAAAQDGKPPPQAGQDLVSVSRAMAAIDLGAPAAPHAMGPAPDGAGSAEAVDPFLAIYALPRDEQAWASFRKLADRAPSLPWGSLGMARIYIAWRILDQAEVEIGRARAVAPGNWIALCLRAEMNERGGKLPAARADYLEVLRADPESPQAHLGLARILAAQGDAAGAHAEALRSLEALPGQTSALGLLGATAAELGRRDEAVDYLARAAAASPRDPAARVALARARLAAGDAAGSVPEWRAAVALEETAGNLAGLASAAEEAGDAGARIEAAQGIVRLDPGPAENWRRLAALRLAARDEEGAEGALKRVVERDPKDAASRLALGRILLGRGQVLLAMDQFRGAGDAARAERAALERRLQVSPIAGADLAVIQRLVAGRLDRLGRDDPDAPPLGGRLVMRVTVEVGGHASEVAVLEDTARDEWVRASAYWNLKDATYPKDKTGRFTFRFAPRAPSVAKAAER